MKFSIATLFMFVAEVAAARQLLEDDCTIIAIGDARLPGRSLGSKYVDEDDDLDFVCEHNGSATAKDLEGTHHLNLTKKQRKLLLKGMNDGSVVSGETTLEGAILSENGEIEIGKQTTFAHHSSRKVYQKKKSILVVRVTDKDGKVIPDSAAQVGDNVFGTLNDSVNLKSQMYDCSYGAVDITNEYSSPNIDDKLSAPGVLDVTIPISINGNRYTVHNAVTAAANAKLGYNLPGQHEQVMYILEKCYQNCGWAAYAYINSWMSVYQDRYYLMTGVQMHEIGHNLGMAHSGGLNGQPYTDHTCLMGNPLYSDDVGKMCFNPAKNWYVNWYDDYKTTVDITKPNISKQITMVGIAEITVNNADKKPAVMKLETGTSDDYFVGFNRATGRNSQNDEADDEVTIIQTGKNGLSYSQSFLKATLKQGESYSIGGLKITATSINIRTQPGTAVITLKKGNSGSGSVSVHLQSIGDKTFSLNEWAGTKGQSRRLEGFQISDLGDISLEYMAHLQGIGDTSWTSGYVGTKGQSRRLEGFAIRLKGESAKKWSVQYSAHLQGIGDTATVKDGAFCGTRGQSRRVEAIFVSISKIESSSPKTYYIKSYHNTHIRIYNYNRVDLTKNRASWEKITIVPVGNNQVALKSAAHGNRYLRVPGRGRYKTIDTQTFIGSYERFYMQTLSNGQVIFRSARWGNYLRASGGERAKLNTQTFVGDWERFTMSPV